MIENELAHEAMDICFQIHYQYGPGLYESVYEDLFCYELQKRKISFTRQEIIPLIHDGVKFNTGFRADVIIENQLLLEFKSIDSIIPLHYKQIQTYLKLTNIRLGLLINFNVLRIKEGVHRVVNKL